MAPVAVSLLATAAPAAKATAAPATKIGSRDMRAFPSVEGCSSAGECSPRTAVTTTNLLRHRTLCPNTYCDALEVCFGRAVTCLDKFWPRLDVFRSPFDARVERAWATLCV